MDTGAARKHTFGRVFDPAARLDSARNVKQLLTELRRSLDGYGIKFCLIANLPRQNTWSFNQHILVNAWPRRWHDRYDEAGFYRFDPCVALSRTVTHPFMWSDASRYAQGKNALRVMDEAAQFGLQAGICTPIPLPVGDPGVVTVAGEEIDLGPTARCCVHALSRHAYFAADRLVGSTMQPRQQRLSPRERQILQWTAAGKTAWEISTILGLAESTVNTHLRNIRNKLNAANIVHAIVEAIRKHEITI